MDINPNITVLMSVYNGEKYLREAIESVLNQTIRNFDFLIINDGSTDKSERIIKSYHDQRIRLIVNKKNIGLIGSLNNGLSMATGKYIARMDCDDISLPRRLEKQLTFLNSRPNIGVVASYTNEINEKGNLLSTLWARDRESISCEEIYHNLFFGNCLAHPTVMINKEILDKFSLKYRSDYLDAEDYDLWCQIAQIAPIVKIPEPLLFYRKHGGNISIAKLMSGKSRSEITSRKIRNEKLKSIGVSFSFSNDVFWGDFNNLKINKALYYLKTRKLITKNILVTAPTYLNEIILKKHAYKKEREFFFQLFFYFFKSAIKKMFPNIIKTH